MPYTPYATRFLPFNDADFDGDEMGTFSMSPLLIPVIPLFNLDYDGDDVNIFTSRYTLSCGQQMEVEEEEEDGVVPDVIIAELD